MEGRASGLIAALGGQSSPLIENWNRSIGELYLTNGAKVYIDGADDGALRIQGKNLSGAWCDEIGLWRSWDRAWNESLAYAVRISPARVVATGTPKMGHPLVQVLLDDPLVPSTHMRTVENLDNLHPAAVEELRRRYEGTRLGRQELEGEFLAQLEGEILKRSWWRYFPPEWIGETLGGTGEVDWQGPPPDGLVSSWDTALKAKTYNDFTAGTLWVTAGPRRYLVRAFRQRVSPPDMARAIRDQTQWAREKFSWLPLRILIENAAAGPEVIADLRRDTQGVLPVQPGGRGDKTYRASAASPILESGNVYAPGADAGDGDFDPVLTPAWAQQVIDECSVFPNGEHDDMVDSVTMALLHRGGVEWRAPDVEERQPQIMAGLVGKQF
jgi:predicted phage terminase large subunit-like protein